MRLLSSVTSTVKRALRQVFANQLSLSKTTRRTFLILLVLAIVAYVTTIGSFKHVKATSTDSDAVSKNISLKQPRRMPFIDGQIKNNDRRKNEYFHSTDSAQPTETAYTKQHGARKHLMVQQLRKDSFHIGQRIIRPGLIENPRSVLGDIHNNFVDEINSRKVISYAKIVVIIAYMRSGSTLVGKLIEQHPNTFYLFEPIRHVVDAFNDERGAEPILTYLEEENRNYRFSDEMKVVLEEIINWVTCRLELLSIESLTNVFHKQFTTQMNKFYRCALVHFERLNFTRVVQTRFPGFTPDTSHLSRIFECLKETVVTCRNSSLIALKFIRLRMRDLEPLLPLFPNMKIIHLNRDPRGIFNSRRILRKVESVKYFATQHCNKVAEDLSVSKSILLKYPDRLKILHYENLADSPILTAKEIYDFIGIEFTNTVRSFIENMTSSKNDTCRFCTERKDSAQTASRWRQNMARSRYGIQSVHLIQEQCKDSNRVLGYLPFTSSVQVRNIKVPTRKRINITEALLSDETF